LSLDQVFLLPLQVAQASLLRLSKQLTYQFLIYVLRGCLQTLLGAPLDRRRKLEILAQLWEICVYSQELLQEAALLDGGDQSDVLNELLQDFSSVFNHRQARRGVLVLLVEVLERATCDHEAALWILNVRVLVHDRIVQLTELFVLPRNPPLAAVERDVHDVLCAGL